MRRDTIKYIRKLNAHQSRIVPLLPNEIICYILKFLRNTKDICTCRLVCSAFNLLIKDIEYYHTVPIYSAVDLVNVIANHKFNSYNMRYKYCASDLLQIVHAKYIIFSYNFGEAWSIFLSLSNTERINIKQHFNLIGCDTIYFVCCKISAPNLFEDSETFKLCNINLLCVGSLSNKCCCATNDECCCFTLHKQMQRHSNPYHEKYLRYKNKYMQLKSFKITANSLYSEYYMTTHPHTHTCS